MVLFLPTINRFFLQSKAIPSIFHSAMQRTTEHLQMYSLPTLFERCQGIIVKRSHNLLCPVTSKLNLVRVSLDLECQFSWSYLEDPGGDVCKYVIITVLLSYWTLAYIPTVCVIHATPLFIRGGYHIQPVRGYEKCTGDKQKGQV